LKDTTASLSSSDIIDIIRASYESGVRELEFQGLRVSFEEKPKPLEMVITAAPHTPESLERDLEENEFEVKQKMLDELMISDPLKYEELLTQGELERDGRYA
jgi:hypothetical protein